MKRKLSPKLVCEFDGMLEHSHNGLSHKTTYCVLTSNLTGKYIHDYLLIYSNKPSGKFSFIESVGKIKHNGQGNLMPVMGSENLYISQTGWYNVSTKEEGHPIFYILDLNGNIEFESKLDGTYAFDVVEISSTYILILSFTEDTSEESFLWKIDCNGRFIWKMQLDDTRLPPIVDEEDNIYIKQGSKISKVNTNGLILWNIELGSVMGNYWETIIRDNNKMYYGFYYDDKHYIMEFDSNGSVINKYIMPGYTLYPIMDSTTNTLYVIMEGTTLVAFDTESKVVKNQVKLKKHTCSTPVIYYDYVIICYEKQVSIYTKNLTLVSTHRLKGIVKGTNITDSVLQILVSDYGQWDNGKSNICYSRLYEICKDMV